jgi:hypothetical protein
MHCPLTASRYPAVELTLSQDRRTVVPGGWISGVPPFADSAEGLLRPVEPGMAS